jgi:hypothetical protein
MKQAASRAPPKKGASKNVAWSEWLGEEKVASRK